jgi:hypothetical protein
MMVIIIIITFLFIVVLFHVRYALFFRYKAHQLWSVNIGRTDKCEKGRLNIQNVISFDFLKQHVGVDEIADPFLVIENGKYYLFAEVMKHDFERIDVFSSDDLKEWKHEGIALSKSYHLSYPQVFRYEGDMYMIPETKKEGNVILFSTNNFPFDWKEKRILIEKPLVDTTVVLHEGNIYLFAMDPSEKLHCYVSDDLLYGTFKEHPMSPMGIGDKLRPAGTPFYEHERIILPVQTNKKDYGYAVHSLIISLLTPEKIIYKKGGSFLRPFSDSKYFNSGVHHICCVKDKGDYIFAFDGRTGTKFTYWRYNKIAFSNMINDLKTFVIMTKNNLKSRIN